MKEYVIYITSRKNDFDGKNHKEILIEANTPAAAMAIALTYYGMKAINQITIRYEYDRDDAE